MDIWTSRLQSTTQQPQRPVPGTKRLIRRHALSPVLLLLLPCPVVHYLSSESAAGAAPESHASTTDAERVRTTTDRSIDRWSRQTPHKEEQTEEDEE